MIIPTPLVKAMGTDKEAREKTEDWKKQASGDERKMKWNRKLKMGMKNGSNGARTHSKTFILQGITGRV